MRTSCAPTMKVRTKLTTWIRTDEPTGSTVTASPSTKAVTSTRSVEPLTRALMSTSPAGNVAPGEGCRPLMIGESPGDPEAAGRDATSGDGDRCGPSITVGVAA